jgi:hypothetical protein
MPYLHRDLIDWLSAKRHLWTMHCWMGMLYGMLLLLDGVRLEFLG